MVLHMPFYDRLVWFNAWEETTELMYVASVAGTLWVFRRGLFHPDVMTPKS